MNSLSIKMSGGYLATKMQFLFLSLFVLCLASVSVGTTTASFNIALAITGNSVTTGVWSNAPTIPVPGPGDVVINEVMWMGTTLSSADEWLELRNTTGDSIDISLWSIEGAGNAGDSIIIPTGVVIPANSFYLISNFGATTSALSDSTIVDYVNSSLSFVNTGEQLTLWDDSGNVIDQTPLGAWAAGVNTSVKQSMERNSVPGDGTLNTSWHTCIDAGCNDTTFWDVEGNDYGTPRATNLSVNDPTASDYVLSGMFIFATTTTVLEDASSTSDTPLPETIVDDNASSSTDVDTIVDDNLGTTTDGVEELPAAEDLGDSAPQSIGDEVGTVIEGGSGSIETVLLESVSNEESLVEVEEEVVVEDAEVVEEPAALPEAVPEVTTE